MQQNSVSLSHLTLYEHVKKDIIALRLFSAFFRVPGRRVGAGGWGWITIWHKLQPEPKFQLKRLNLVDLLGGLGLCWRWTAYEAGWRC